MWQRMMWLTLMVVLAGGAGVRAEEASVTPIPLKITYSLDGQEFTAAAPALAPGAKLWVRVSWEGFERPEGAKQPYLSVLSAAMDFASANGGRQTWGGQPQFIQRVNPPYVATNVTAMTYRLDLGARAAGTMGYMNQWSKEKNCYVDGPLGACPALAPGTYRFTVKVYYAAKPGGPVVGRGQKTISLTMKEADPKPGAGDKTQPVKAKDQHAAALPAGRGVILSVAAALATGAMAVTQAPPAPRAGPNSWPGALFVAPAGDDRAEGNQTHPLRTLGKALALAGPGTVITLAEGTYHEGDLVMPRGGAPGQPLTILGQQAGQVLIEGSQPVKDWKPQGHGVWQVADWPVDSQQLFVDGRPLQQIGIHNKWQQVGDIGGYHKIVILPPVGRGLADLKPGSFYYDAGTRTLSCMLADRTDPNTHDMEASVKDFVLHGGKASYVVLRNLVFRYSNMTAKNSRDGGVVNTGPAHWTIEDCQFNSGDFGGLGMLGDHHTVRRCRICDNGAVGVNINGSDAAHGWHWYLNRAPQDILLEDLEVSGNNYRHFYDQWHAGGLKLVPCCRGITIRHCRVVDNRGPGIWFDGGLGSNVIEDNLVQGNTTGIFYEIAQPAPGDQFGALIRNNRVLGSRNQGIYISASESAIVENNTCWGNRWNIVLHGMPRREFGGRKLIHNRVERNILGDARIDVVLFDGKDAADNIVDDNFYARLPGAAAGDGLRVSVTQGAYDQGLYTSLAALRSATGLETHGQVGDPRWVDAGQGDFRLQAGSPAAGQGWQPAAKQTSPALSRP